MTARNDRTYSEEFDNVVVASGHFSVPNVPYFEGFETFQGRVLHSHDFRDATEFKGKDVLVVGRSYSAEDIGSQCYKYGAKSITVSYRSAPMAFNFPEGWEQKPLLQKVVGKTAHFKDGSTKEIDAIILCTGYLHSFPFLTDDLKLKTNNRMWPLGIYKGVVWEKNPALFYIGMQDQFYTFNMFDAQAWYARDVILGRIKLPSAKEMAADSAEMARARGDARRRRTDDLVPGRLHQGADRGDRLSVLRHRGDQQDLHGVGAPQDGEHHGFSRQRLPSLMTGTMAPKHHTKWMEAMDDSLESYLQVK